MANTKKNPKVSIIMPVYNAAAYLPETIDSILRQTFTDFEFIIVNDGSRDDSAAVIDAYAACDQRIKAQHQANQGLVKTLNAAVKLARGDYIARVDADDPSFDNRLEKQVALLDKDPDVILVGGGFEIIDENGYFLETVHAVTRDEDIRRALLLRNPYGHAGVMYRKATALAAGLYSGNHGPAEDYDLWIRLSKLGRLAAIPHPVYRYRVVSSGISQSNSKEQMQFTKQLSDALWRNELPRLLTRRELLTQCNRYLALPVRPAYAIGVKRQFLFDNARLAAKLLRYGRPLQGLWQLLIIASLGRSGLAEVKKRLAILAHLSA